MNYDYTLDDLMVVKENSFTQKGILGIKDIFSYDSFTGFFGIEKKLVVGGRYRPLSIATFALEYHLMGGFSPVLSHCINILLFALTCILIYLILKKLIKPTKADWWFHYFPFVVAIIFLSHPVHTEVVANIKGRDEILALLLSLVSLWLILKYIDKKNVMFLVSSNLLLFLGLLSKENAIAFIVLIPITLHFFCKITLRQNLSIGFTLIFTASIFLFVRFLVLGYVSGGKLPDELLNNPFLEATVSQKFGTILFTLGQYLKLLVFPYSLTHDYYPYHIPLVSFFSPKAIIPLLIYIAIILWAVIKGFTKDWLSYAAWFYLIPLFIVSNILFPVGTFMNERFVYMSSLGFCMAFTYLLTVKVPPYFQSQKHFEKISLVMLITILLLFSIRTITRNEVWKDNFTLFTRDVLVASNSIKCNIAAGGEWMKIAEKETDSVNRILIYEKSLGYLEKAISLYPKATNGLILYGNALATYKKNPKQAIDQYLKVLDYNPNEKHALGNILKVLNSIDNAKELDFKIAVYAQLWKFNPNDYDVNYTLGKLYGQFKGNLDSSTYFLERSLSLAPDNVAAYKDLGIVYSLKGDFQKALETFSKANGLAPDDRSVLQNIMITKRLMQQREKNKPD